MIQLGSSSSGKISIPVVPLHSLSQEFEGLS